MIYLQCREENLPTKKLYHGKVTFKTERITFPDKEKLVRLSSLELPYNK